MIKHIGFTGHHLHSEIRIKSFRSPHADIAFAAAANPGHAQTVTDTSNFTTGMHFGKDEMPMPDSEDTHPGLSASLVRTANHLAAQQANTGDRFLFIEH